MIYLNAVRFAECHNCRPVKDRTGMKTFLIASTGNLFSPAFYVMGAALITFITVMRAKETAGLPLRR